MRRRTPCARPTKGSGRGSGRVGWRSSGPRKRRAGGSRCSPRPTRRRRVDPADLLGSDLLRPALGRSTMSPTQRRWTWHTQFRRRIAAHATTSTARSTRPRPRRCAPCSTRSSATTRRSGSRSGTGRASDPTTRWPPSASRRPMRCVASCGCRTNSASVARTWRATSSWTAMCSRPSRRCAITPPSTPAEDGERRWRRSRPPAGSAHWAAPCRHRRRRLVSTGCATVCATRSDVTPRRSVTTTTSATTSTGWCSARR